MANNSLLLQNYLRAAYAGVGAKPPYPTPQQILADPFHGCAPAFTQMKHVTVAVEMSVSGSFDYSGNTASNRQCVTVNIEQMTPQQQPFPAFENAAVDRNKCFLYDLHLNEYRAPILDGHLVTSLSFRHAAQNVREREDFDNIATSMGLPVRTFARFGKRCDEWTSFPSDRVAIPKPILGAEPYVIKTLGLANGENIERGVIRIPHQHCLKLELPVWKGNFGNPPDDFALEVRKKDPNANVYAAWQDYMNQQVMRVYENDKARFESDLVKDFYAIPTAHVFAYSFRSRWWAQKHGYHFQELTLPSSDVVFYYLVTDKVYEKIKADVQCVSRSIDCRPFRELGLSFFPVIDKTATFRGNEGRFELHLRFTMNYMVVPEGLDASRLAIVPDPSYPLPPKKPTAAASAKGVDDDSLLLLQETPYGVLPPRPMTQEQIKEAMTMAK